MKLITFTESGNTRIGLLKDDGVVDLSVADPSLPTTMLAFIEAGDDAMAKAAAVVGQAPHFASADVSLEAPIARPPKILAIGLNYRAHAAESNMEIPKHPVVFTKQATSATGPYSPVYSPKETQMLDYEGELGIVIGKRCRRVSQADAPKVIAGFCVLNDVSVREWQFLAKPPQFTMGKSWDTHNPFGPSIVTPDEVDPHNLILKTFVNGEERQSTNTNDLIFNCYEIIEFLSTAFTLEPGDVIATGTPSGVGAAMKPPRPLQIGDKVRVEIAGLGFIENEIVTEPDVAMIR
ncbi:MAG: 2-keto-4-pentenoate hydratase/2-oxohepta-3-ene-1,7-dioic acid hydratase in catechol pathway [Candidatus Azotimanducaceae bacterium]|jgi:2-keto-4-pentenoate hydratase/2-oxohepta-3-ene-1,7-dioic acid hydratase in catechol pathway